MYIPTNFQVFSVTLTSFRRGVFLFPPLQNELLKSRPRLGLIRFWIFDSFPVVTVVPILEIFEILKIFYFRDKYLIHSQPTFLILRQLLIQWNGYIIKPLNHTTLKNLALPSFRVILILLVMNLRGRHGWFSWLAFHKGVGVGKMGENPAKKRGAWFFLCHE